MTDSTHRDADTSQRIPLRVEYGVAMLWRKRTLNFLSSRQTDGERALGFVGTDNFSASKCVVRNEFDARCGQYKLPPRLRSQANHCPHSCPLKLDRFTFAKTSTESIKIRQRLCWKMIGDVAARFCRCDGLDDLRASLFKVRLLRGYGTREQGCPHKEQLQNRNRASLVNSGQLDRNSRHEARRSPLAAGVVFEPLLTGASPRESAVR